ncbi:hypothetical protein COLO4_04174 [Corchorus olitorius]|uniref:Uncharacterized protein n=1 Tax=Corchorus olitorius TaxID=93759 RepID=A0A1R3KV01_9ROSI|nr:hypothetical protein COLO4_04174 [Corchorus olitorius]
MDSRLTEESYAWNTCFALVLWALWKARCKREIEGSSCSIGQITSYATNLSREVDRAWGSRTTKVVRQPRWIQCKLPDTGWLIGSPLDFASLKPLLQLSYS